MKASAYICMFAHETNVQVPMANLCRHVLLQPQLCVPSSWYLKLNVIMKLLNL